MNSPNEPVDSGPSPAARLAALSLWLPLGVIIVSGYFRRFGMGVSHPVQVALGLSLIVAAFAGFGCGIASLCRRQSGETNVVGRSIAGLALSSILLALFSAAFIGGFAKGYTQAVQARQTMASLHKSIKEANADVRNSFDPTNGIKANPAVFDKAISQAKKASQELKGESALVMDASAAFLTDLQGMSKAYDAEFKRLQNAHVLSPTNLTSKEQLKGRKDVVQRFLAVNDDLDRFIAGSESTFKNELTTRNVSAPRIQREVDEFRRTSAPRAPLVREIRASDRRIGTAMMNVLGILESEWGRWRYDAESGRILFSDTASRDRYTAQLDAMGTAGREQIAMQKRLLDVQSTVGQTASP